MDGLEISKKKKTFVKSSTDYETLLTQNTVSIVDHLKR